MAFKLTKKALKYISLKINYIYIFLFYLLANFFSLDWKIVVQQAEPD